MDIILNWFFFTQLNFPHYLKVQTYSSIFYHRVMTPELKKKLDIFLSQNCLHNKSYGLDSTGSNR